MSAETELHDAICNAVILLNNGEEIAPEVSAILRTALAKYNPAPPAVNAQGLQQAQVVGGKIANGHHCGLPEYLCKHPSHAPQPSAPVVGDALRAAAQAVVTGKVNPSAGRTRLVMLKDVQALESALTGRG
jgi:hypothetical protein